MTLPHHSLSLNLLRPISLCPTGYCWPVLPHPILMVLVFLDFMAGPDIELSEFHYIGLDSQAS